MTVRFINTDLPMTRTYKDQLHRQVDGLGEGIACYYDLMHAVCDVHRGRSRNISYKL